MEWGRVTWWSHGGQMIVITLHESSLSNSPTAYVREMLDSTGSLEDFERRWTPIEQTYLESTFDAVCLLFVQCLVLFTVHIVFPCLRQRVELF